MTSSASRLSAAWSRFGLKGEEAGLAMALPDDFKLIREIVAAGGSRHTTGSIDRSRYQRLVDLEPD
jgi:hypothetical protein